MTLDNIAESIGTLEYGQESDDGERLVTEESSVEQPETTAEDMWSPQG